MPAARDAPVPLSCSDCGAALEPVTWDRADAFLHGRARPDHQCPAVDAEPADGGFWVSEPPTFPPDEPAPKPPPGPDASLTPQEGAALWAEWARIGAMTPRERADYWWRKFTRA